LRKILIGAALALSIAGTSFIAAAPANAYSTFGYDYFYDDGTDDLGTDGQPIPDIFNIDEVDISGNDILSDYSTEFDITLANNVAVDENSFTDDPLTEIGTGNLELDIDEDSDGYADYQVVLPAFTGSYLLEYPEIYDVLNDEYLNCSADVFGEPSDGPQITIYIDQGCLPLPETFSFWVNSNYIDSNGTLSNDFSPSETGVFFASNPWSSFDSGTPNVSGTAKVGKKLTAKVGSWASGATVKYQWYRGSSKISGATKKTYTLSKKDKGKKIKVRVVVSATGYFSTTRYSQTTSKVK
jgi:hypothetical protein